MSEISKKEKIQDYTFTVWLHASIGLVMLMPFVLSGMSSTVLAALDPNTIVHGADHEKLFKPLFPVLMMITTIVALYFTTFRAIKVTFTKQCLCALICGVSYVAWYIGQSLGNDVIGIVCGVIVPFFHVRYAAKGLIKREANLSKV